MLATLPHPVPTLDTPAQPSTLLHPGSPEWPGLPTDLATPPDLYSVEPRWTAPPTEPGVFEELPDWAYHTGEAISSSLVRRLAAGITPRQVRYEQLRGRKDTDAFEFGRAVHTLALHFGPPVVEIAGFKDWKTKKAQALRAHYRKLGAIPLLSPRYAEAHAMATAIRTHPVMVPLLEWGWPEVSVYWRDPRTQLMLRARPDWMAPDGDDVIAVDIKTADSADPEQFVWSILRYLYHLQQDWYQQGLLAHGIVSRFLFAVVSKHPPHVVTVCEIDPADLEDAASQNRAAVDLWARCLAEDVWPDHGPGIHRIHLPLRAGLRHHR